MAKDKITINTKVVAVKHLTYDLKQKNGTYYYKTIDKVKTGDIVYCDTINGLSVCQVVSVYNTIDDLFTIKLLPPLYELKFCRKKVAEDLSND